ncbi:MAG: hypothetical protein Q8L55_12335 [Phycisphaerales bacterium]|nr:hypothetical protein [Phycisphaerales bacterium]
MPKGNVPTIRLHKASGQYVSDLNSKTRYFGKDLEAAWAAFLPELAAWREATGRKDCVSVREAAQALASMVAADCGHPDTKLALSHLKDFLTVHGDQDVSAIGVDEIEKYKRSCLTRFSPKTTNHFLGAAKRLMRYAAFRGWRAPMELSFIGMVNLPTPQPKHLPLKELGEWIQKADERCPNLGVWLRVGLATGARPSELIKIVRGEFTLLEEGVLCLTKGKTNKVVNHPRCLVVVPAVQKLLAEAKPQWSHICTLSQACSRTFDSGPHRLRHSSAYLIHRLPGEAVTRDATDVFLGHYPKTVSLIYNPIDWRPVTALAERYLGYLRAALPAAYPLL